MSLAATLMAPMLGNLARRALFELTRNASETTRRQVLASLAQDSCSYEVFQALGKVFSVGDISVNGKYGVIEGSIADTRVMAAYARGEPWGKYATALLLEFFTRRGAGTYIDVGANIGLTTIPVARLPEMSITSIEPGPANFRHLSRNVAINCPGATVQLIEAAVLDHSGTVDFALDSFNHGDHRVHYSHANGLYDEASRPIIKVRAMRLDDLLEDGPLSRPLAIKLDTQGAEARIFAGGQEVIAGADLVFFEFMPYLSERMGGDLKLLTDLVEESFTEGAISSGDGHVYSVPNWRPISEIAEIIYDHMSQARGNPYVYDTVVVRK
jgi:FkbM family methyltransferase